MEGKAIIFMSARVSVGGDALFRVLFAVRPVPIVRRDVSLVSLSVTKISNLKIKKSLKRALNRVISKLIFFYNDFL